MSCCLKIRQKDYCLNSFNSLTPLTPSLLDLIQCLLDIIQNIFDILDTY